MTYVLIQVDDQPQQSTSKTKQSTTNAMYNDTKTVVVKPDSLIKFEVMSYHRNSPDRILGVGVVKMADLPLAYPPTQQTANVQVPLRKAVSATGPKAQFLPEEFPSNIFPTNMKLSIQICDWPEVHHAINLVGGTTGNTVPNVASPQNMQSLTQNMSGMRVAGSTNSPNRTGPISALQKNDSQASVSTLSTTLSSISGTSNLPPIPQHYEMRTDNNTGRPYYVDHLTRTTTWERPLPLPENWERRKDNASGRIYFVDHQTRRTQWEHPNATNAANNRNNQQNQHSRMQNYLQRNLEALGVNENDGENKKGNSNEPQKQVSKGNGEILDYQTLKTKNKATDGLMDELDEEYDTIEASKLDEILGKLPEGWEEKKNNGRKYYLRRYLEISK